MLKITTTQITALDAVSKARFKAAMVEHLAAWSPFTLKVAKREGLTALVDEGVEAAQADGLIHVGPARLYLELACLFGPGFADDPLTPWAGEILRSDRYADDVDRGFLLKRAAGACLLRVSGADGALARAAMLRLRGALTRPAPEGLDADGIAAELAALYPERALDAGEDGLRRLVEAAATDPACALLPQNTGPLLIAGLHLAIGARATRDPRHPWVIRALAHPADDAPAARAERLRTRSAIFVDAVIAEMS